MSFHKPELANCSIVIRLQAVRIGTFTRILIWPSLDTNFFYFTASFLADVIFPVFGASPTLQSLATIAFFDALIVPFLHTSQILVYDHGQDYWDHEQNQRFSHFVFYCSFDFQNEISQTFLSYYKFQPNWFGYLYDFVSWFLVFISRIYQLSICISKWRGKRF